MSKNIKRQIIQGTSSSRHRRKAVKQRLIIEDLLKSARAMETANEQTSEMEKQQLHAVGKRNSTSGLKLKKNPYQKKQLNKTKCGLCGGNFPHQNECPAQGESCHKCEKLNHFSKVCRGKTNNYYKQSKQHAKTVTTEERGSDNNEAYTFTTGAQVNQIK